jgi:predicted flap endonuclease-1-like 5' DNA nuclease
MRPPGSIPALSPTAPSAPSFRPDGGRVQELLAQLMSARKELAETGTELRKVINERNALRIRLVQAENSARELASASRAEAELRAEFVDAHAASSAALRARVSELEAALANASRAPKPEERLSLRQIRGIGPAFERALLGLGMTTVSQIATLGTDEIGRIAPLIGARADRILRDDWVGQAKRLLGE